MHIQTDLQQRIETIIKSSVGHSVDSIELLPGAGSNRQYLRVIAGNSSYIVCNGTNVDENKSFEYLCNHFKNKGLRVPKLFGMSNDASMYVLQDLGSTDLLSYKQKTSEHNWMPLYKQALLDIYEFQCIGHSGLDYTKCYARSEFDHVYMQWDLSYFKYYYCKLTDIEINEQKLEADFNSLIHFLLQAPRSFFMYRDFQSRNIMVHENTLWYIDFQGGMRGPLQYDVVSLLYQAKADFNPQQRFDLLQYYIDIASNYSSINRTEFELLYEGFVFIRILQTLGAYGYRGIIQKKPHFIASIPQALENVKNQCSKIAQIIHIPYLQSVIQQLPVLQIH